MGDLLAPVPPESGIGGIRGHDSSSVGLAHTVAEVPVKPPHESKLFPTNNRGQIAPHQPENFSLSRCSSRRVVLLAELLSSVLVRKGDSREVGIECAPAIQDALSGKFTRATWDVLKLELGLVLLFHQLTLACIPI